MRTINESLKPKVSSLPKGISTETPFAMTVHAAYMLNLGIAKYQAFNRQRYGEGATANYCLGRTYIAIEEAAKLQRWMQELAPDVLTGLIGRINVLIDELELDAARFYEASKKEEEGTDPLGFLDDPTK